MRYRTRCGVIRIIQGGFCRGAEVGGGIEKHLMFRRNLKTHTKAWQGHGGVHVGVVRRAWHGVCAYAREHHFLKTCCQQQPIMQKGNPIPHKQRIGLRDGVVAGPQQHVAIGQRNGPPAPYAARIAAAIYGGKGFALGVIPVIIPVAQHQIIHAALPFQRRCKAGAKAALCVICPHRAVAICRYGQIQHIGHGLRAVIQAGCGQLRAACGIAIRTLRIGCNVQA